MSAVVPLLAAIAAALAMAAVAEGFEASVRARQTSKADPSVPVLAVGLLFALAMALADGGAVLSWRFGVGEGTERVLLPGVGVALGGALVAALGGILLLGAATFAPPAPGARKAGLGALGGAAAAVVGGIAVAVARLASLPEGLRAAGAWPLALLLGLAGVLGFYLLEAAGFIRSGREGDGSRAAPALRLAAALALAAAVAAGLEAWWRDGTYATSLTAAASATALLGLAAVEPGPRFGIVPRLLFLAALLVLVFV